MGYGGPHAAYFNQNTNVLCQEELSSITRYDGNRALRMALQTREQH
jgi:glycine cleavage system pyridoxal-binding protein P